MITLNFYFIFYDENIKNIPNFCCNNTQKSSVLLTVYECCYVVNDIPHRIKKFKFHHKIL